MNKIYTLLLMLTISGQAFASWEPFPLNQKSYYTFVYGDSMINSVYMDTMVQRPNYQAIFFNHKYYGYVYGNCYPVFVNVNQPVMQFGYYGQLEFDSLIISGDTLFYTPPLSTPQYLLLNVAIGQSWPFLSYTITCVSDTVMQFLGITDSVKLFSGLPNSTIILSKNHGFISYPQFNTSPVIMHTLTGFSDQTGSYGFIKPTYLDFMPYQSGDLRFWKFSQEPPLSLPIINYRIDSITSVSYGPDTIKIFYDYVWYNNNTVNYNSAQENYSVNLLKNLLEAPTNWLAFTTDNNSGNYYSINGTASYKKVSDGSIDYLYIDAGYLADTGTCALTQVLDYGQLYSYNTYQGLTEISSDVFYPISQRLVGSVIGGIPRGDTSNTVGIGEINNYSLGIFPNPASDFLKIANNNGTHSEEFSIYDISGRVIKQGITSANTIDVRELRSGIYFLRLTTEMKSVTVMFVKGER